MSRKNGFTLTGSRWRACGVSSLASRILAMLGYPGKAETGQSPTGSPTYRGKLLKTTMGIGGQFIEVNWTSENINGRPKTPYRLFHGGNTGSIPVGRANDLGGRVGRGLKIWANKPSAAAAPPWAAPFSLPFVLPGYRTNTLPSASMVTSRTSPEPSAKFMT